ncbi:hypothetical protein [Lignipirellula cremea]|uniref:Uncharacterized protein n=1 Tax=Lignipirellula cremea TaxID=2528010 RepID=A0A518DMA3_9BACT|nr:hypothetical protein [Lignipirellula cremea]QDU92970.1 hypothetical protein Pla8534_07430 [Lignipirellula cremea]
MASILRSRFALVSLLTVVVVAGIAVAGNGNGQNALKSLAQALKQEVNSNPEFDPTGNTALAQEVRATFIVKSILPVAIVAQAPVDGQNFPEGAAVTFHLQLENWLWDPSRATSAGSAYANGNNEPNIGHLHGWLYELTSGDLVRFYGANLNGAVTYDAVTGDLFFTQNGLEPGVYKMYFQAQNNDHTAQAVPAAPNLPAMETVVFTVGDASLEDLQP